MKKTWAVIAIERKQPHREPFTVHTVIGPGIHGYGNKPIVYETITCSDVLCKGSFAKTESFLELFQQPDGGVVFTKLIHTRLWEPEEN